MAELPRKEGCDHEYEYDPVDWKMVAGKCIHCGRELTRKEFIYWGYEVEEGAMGKRKRLKKQRAKDKAYRKIKEAAAKGPRVDIGGAPHAVKDFRFSVDLDDIGKVFAGNFKTMPKVEPFQAEFMRDATDDSDDAFWAWVMGMGYRVHADREAEIRSAFTPQMSPVEKKRAALRALAEHPETPEHERSNAQRRLAEMEEKYG